MSKPYESEFTLFLKDLKQRKPSLEAEQRAGRALLWDRQPLDLEQAELDQRSRVAQRAYPYQTDP